MCFLQNILWFSPKSFQVVYWEGLSRRSSDPSSLNLDPNQARRGEAKLGFCSGLVACSTWLGNQLGGKRLWQCLEHFFPLVSGVVSDQWHWWLICVKFQYKQTWSNKVLDISEMLVLSHWCLRIHWIFGNINSKTDITVSGRIWNRGERHKNGIFVDMEVHRWTKKVVQAPQY